MKWFTIRILAASICLALVWHGPAQNVFRGEIMDTQCANMGSHQLMMKKEGARDTAECVRDCVKMGGKFVLYDSSADLIYQLDDQRLPEAFAGQNVSIKGSYDSATKMIHVESIQPVSRSSLDTSK
jgi:hypothetical protein